MIPGVIKFAYSYGFLDCFMMMSGDTQKMRDKHAWVTEEMAEAFLPDSSIPSVQQMVNEMNKAKIWKVIVDTMQGKMMSDVINKDIKDKLSSY